MDVSNDASIIALGLGDYAADTDLNEVGMVRVYAYSCDDNEWQRLGQDLIGANEYEMFVSRELSLLFPVHFDVHKLTVVASFTGTSC